MAKDRSDQARKACEWQVLLRLESPATQNVQSIGASSGVIEQARLANARFALNDDDRATTGPDLADQGIQPFALPLTSDEHYFTLKTL
jgi:hypothetical protein